jgi:hypothetical protein
VPARLKFLYLKAKIRIASLPHPETIHAMGKRKKWFAAQKNGSERKKMA